MSSNVLNRNAPLMIALGLTPEQIDHEVDLAREEAGIHMVLESITEGRKNRAEELAKKQGVTRQTAYRQLQKEKFKDVPEGMSKKDGILEALFRLNVNSGVDPSTLLSALKNMRVQTDLGDMLGRVWDLQKSGFVKFNETHTSHGSELRRIRLTPAGRAEAIRLRGGTPRQHEERVNARSLTVNGFSQSPRMGDHKPVGVDGTDFRNHRKVAKGGPITKISGKPKPEVVEAEPWMPHPPGETDVTPPEVPVAPMTVVYVFEPKDFPAISDLIDRRVDREFRRMKAARVVEAASIMAEVDGLEAERLLEMAAEIEGPSFNDLERDILKLIDHLNNHAGDVKE